MGCGDNQSCLVRARKPECDGRPRCTSTRRSRSSAGTPPVPSGTTVADPGFNSLRPEPVSMRTQLHNHEPNSVAGCRCKDDPLNGHALEDSCRRGLNVSDEAARGGSAETLWVDPGLALEQPTARQFAGLRETAAMTTTPPRDLRLAGSAEGVGSCRVPIPTYCWSHSLCLL